jgi:serine/threonine-protein kinase ULK/ATG1
LDDEIKILGSVKHPNLVAFVDAVPRTERIYVVLEFLAGGDLQKFIRSKGRLQESTAQKWIGHLAAGLECLWSRSLVHRDLKPQNLLLTEASDQGILKIGDFGFARQLGPSKLAETLCGSPLYMAPEILALKRYDAKADLWSAGTVLFEMVAGRPPYTGRDHRDLLRNIRRKALRLPKDVTVSRECLDVLQKLLRRDPLKRCAFEDFFRDPFVNGCALTQVVGDPFALAPVAEVSSSPPEKLASPILRKATAEAASSLLATRPPFMTQKSPSAPFAALVSSSSSSPRATPRRASMEGRPPRSPTSLKKPSTMPTPPRSAPAWNQPAISRR